MGFDKRHAKGRVLCKSKARKSLLVFLGPAFALPLVIQTS
jgi:hypothetical protein